MINLSQIPIIHDNDFLTFKRNVGSIIYCSQNTFFNIRRNGQPKENMNVFRTIQPIPQGIILIIAIKFSSSSYQII